MKRYISLLLVFVMLLLTACGTAGNAGNPTSTEQNGIEPTEGVTSDPTKEATPTDSTGDSSGTGTADATTETGNTQGFTDETTKPTQDSTVPGDYTLSLSRKSLSLEIGQVGNLQLTYTGTGTITWASSDTSIATVSNGKVSAKKVGTAVITVSDGAKHASCVVTVTKKTENTTPATLKFSDNLHEMKVDDTKTLSVTYTGTKSLSWSSSNSDVATVSNGKVTAKAAGTAFVTVSDGVVSATCEVKVTNKQAPVEVKISVSPTTLSLVVGNTSTLTATYNGTGTLKWSSSDTSVVTVSNGTVTAKNVGSATITVSDGSKSATCKVTVTAPATATTTLKISGTNTTINTGETLQLKYTYDGKNTLSWASSDTSVVTVNSTGVVTAKAKGAALVTVTDGVLSSSILISVVQSNKPASTSIGIDNLNAPLSDGVAKYAGDSMSFRTWADPYESKQGVTVTTSNSGVVSVSNSAESNGYHWITLKFQSAGSATITLKSADGAVTKSYTIKVNSGYSYNPGSGQLTPEQAVNAFNGVISANGASTSGTPSGYLVWTVKPGDLTWSKVKKEAEGAFHSWWKIGYRTIVLTYEGTDENGNYIFYERGC